MAQLKSSEFMGQKSVPSLLWRFALPAMASSFVNCLYNIVDRLYIGRSVGADAMAGLSLTFPYMIILASFGMMVGQGSGAVVSLLLGEKKVDSANKVLGQAIAMLLLFILTIQVLGLLFLDETLIWFGGTPASIPFARDYLVIILWGNIFQHISFGISNILRAEGSSVEAMGVIILGAVLNIILDPIFIFVFKMGIRGAALATIIAMAVSSSWVMIHFIRGSVLKLRLSNIRLYPGLFWRVLAIGMAPCLMQIVHCLVAVLYNHAFKLFAPTPALTDVCIAAFGVLNPVMMFLLTPTFGINMGVQPIIGYNTGARLYARVIYALRLSVQMAMLLCFICSCLMYFCAVPIAHCFTKDETLANMTIYALRVAAVGFTFIAPGILSGSYFQSIGKAKKSVVLSLLRQCIMLIPLIFFMPWWKGYVGIWWAGAISDILSGVLCLGCVWWEIRRLKRLV